MTLQQRPLFQLVGICLIGLAFPLGRTSCAPAGDQTDTIEAPAANTRVITTSCTDASCGAGRRCCGVSCCPADGCHYCGSDGRCRVWRNCY